MFRLKDERLHPDVHDWGRLHRCGDGKKSSCTPSSPSVSREAQTLQPTIEVQSLKRVENIPLFPSIQPSCTRGGVSSMCSRGIMRLCADVHDPSGWIHVTIFRANKEFIYLLFKIFFSYKKKKKKKSHWGEIFNRRKAASWSFWMCGTRNPDALSRRQRRRQQKLLSRKEDFSGGMFWGNELTGPLLQDPSAQKPAQSQCWVSTVVSRLISYQHNGGTTNMWHTYTSVRIQIKRTQRI